MVIPLLANQNLTPMLCLLILNLKTSLLTSLLHHLGFIEQDIGVNSIFELRAKRLDLETGRF